MIVAGLALYLSFALAAFGAMTVPSITSIWKDAWLAGRNGREFDMLELKLTTDDYLLPSAYARYLAGVEARGRVFGEAGLTSSIARASCGRLALLTGAHDRVVR